MITLDLDEITIRVGKRILFNKFCWQSHGGQLWAFIGCNGLGKSTLLHCIANLHTNYEGTININSKNIKTINATKLAQQVSLLWQIPEMKYQHSVLEVVLANRYPWRNSKLNDSAIAYQQLNHMQIASFANRDYESLSGGEQQRVEIAAILTQDTPIILMDEPLNHLDIIQRHRVMSHLQMLAKEKNKLILITLHDITMAEKYCSHCLGLLGEGDIISEKISKLDLNSLMKNYTGSDQLFGDCETTSS